VVPLDAGEQSAARSGSCGKGGIKPELILRRTIRMGFAARPSYPPGAGSVVIRTLLWLSTAAQKLALGQDTPNSSQPPTPGRLGVSIVAVVLQALPSQVATPPFWSTSTQSRAVGHDTEVGWSAPRIAVCLPQAEYGSDARHNNRPSTQRNGPEPGTGPQRCSRSRSTSVTASLTLQTDSHTLTLTESPLHLTIKPAYTVNRTPSGGVLAATTKQDCGVWFNRLEDGY
jgi:hypothetical protein